MIVAGSDDPTASDFAVARFLPGGSLDEVFGAAGWAVIQLGGRHTVALQANDKIVVAGESLDVKNNHRDFVLARLKRHGKADAKFGGAGYVLTDFGGDSQANAVAIQEDGKIVAARWCVWPPDPRRSRSAFEPWLEMTDDCEWRARCFALARYNKDGSLDDSFGTQGMEAGKIAGGDTCAHASAIQPTGELVAAGVARDDYAEGSSDFACARYRADGRLDQAFGAEGLATVALTAAEDTARAIALQDDGKIVLAGTAADRAAKESHFALVRLDADGQLDTSFNGEGAVVTRDFRGGASGVTIQADGAILAAGYATVGERDLFARYRDDGSLDPAFGVGGVMFLDLGGVIDRANAITVNTEKILLAGPSRCSKTQIEFALARLLPGAH